MRKHDPNLSGSIFSGAVEELRRRGFHSEGQTVVAIWDTCFGGCGFDLSEAERSEAANIARFLFFCPDVPAMLLRQISGKLRDPLLRDGVRGLAENMDKSGFSD